ncbi:unnamed protein product, partial [Cuscuta europaea]
MEGVHQSYLGFWGGISNPNYIILQVKMYTQSWVASLPTHKIRITGDILFQEGLIPKHFRLQGYKPHIIKWQLPVKKWKINVDVGYLAGKARGGTVPRDRRGGFVMAICFPMCATSSLEAELKAILSATRWAMEEGFVDFQVESDSTLAMEYIAGKKSKWASDIQEVTDLAFRKGVDFGQMKRECNWVAHHMAQFQTDGLKVFSGLDQLPTPAK